ncbi:Adhesive plaque matrix protein [Diplonema papillatum]|nr:Adhesive plaque matrix protein [Diplonema papillatum]
MRWSSTPLNGGGQCAGIASSGSDVFVGHATGLQRFDCADPELCQSAVERKFLIPQAVASSGGGYVYVATADGVEALHPSNLSTAFWFSGSNCTAVAAGDAHVFTACTTASGAGLYAFDLSLVHLGTATCAGGSPSMLFFEETTTKVYVALDTGVQAFEVADPANMVGGTLFSADEVTGIAASEEYIWLATADGLKKYVYVTGTQPITSYQCTTNCSTSYQCTTDCSTSYQCTTNCSAGYQCTINCSTSYQCTTNCSTSYQCTTNCSTSYQCTTNCSTSYQCTTNCSTSYQCTTDCSTSYQCTTNCSTSYQCTTNCSTSYQCTTDCSTSYQCTTNCSASYQCTTNCSTSYQCTTNCSTSYQCTTNCSTSYQCTTNCSASYQCTTNCSTSYQCTTDCSTSYQCTTDCSTSYQCTTDCSTSYQCTTDSPRTTVPPALTFAPPETAAPPTAAQNTVVPSAAPAAAAPPGWSSAAPGTAVPSAAPAAAATPAAPGWSSAAPPGAAATAPPSAPPPSTEAPDSHAPSPAPAARENVTDLIKDSGVKEAAQAIGTAVPVVAATTALAGSTGGSANRLLLVVSGCYTKEKHDFPFTFHPTGLVISGSPAFGMVVGNFLVNAGFSAVCFLVLSAGRHFRAVTSSSYLQNLDIQGFLRLPSLPLLVFTLLFQGSALGSMILIYDPPSAIALVAGLCSVAFCVAVPVLVFFKVRKGVPSLAFFMRDDRYIGFGWRFVIGKGEWVSAAPRLRWAHRYRSVLTLYREDKAWFGSLGFGSSFALAALSAPVTEDYTSCGHVKLCSALVVLIELAAMSWVWPYSRSRDALADMVISFSEGGGMLLMATGYYKGEPYHWTHSMASILLMAAMFTVMVQMLLDLATEAFVFFTQRRVRLQELVFARSRCSLDSVLSGKRVSSKDDEVPFLFGKDDVTSITLLLPDNSPGDIELSPRHSMLATETNGGKLNASARQLSASFISSSPSDCVFPQQDDSADAPLLLSPTVSHASLSGEGLRSPSVRSARRSRSPSLAFAGQAAAGGSLGKRLRRLSSGGVSAAAPLEVPQDPHFHPSDDFGRSRRCSFLSPRASPPEEYCFSSTLELPLSPAGALRSQAQPRVNRRSQPLPRVTSPLSSSAHPPRRRRAATMRSFCCYFHPSDDFGRSRRCSFLSPRASPPEEYCFSSTLELPLSPAGALRSQAQPRVNRRSQPLPRVTSPLSSSAHPPRRRRAATMWSVAPAAVEIVRS